MTIHTDPQRKIKCVVWDLDGTLWDGTLLEGDAGEVRPSVMTVIRALDERGVLHAIASRNDEGEALRKLRAAGVHEYFLCPQIGWGAKSRSIETVAQRLGLGLDAMAFVDDQPFELAEVAYALPQVLCLATGEIEGMLDLPELTPRFQTDECRRRRALYRVDEQRQSEEEAFSGPSEAFLRGLDMVFTIFTPAASDLQRAEELTVRTHQLNTTGVTHDYDELAAFLESDRHVLLMAELADRFGPYGKIGLALVERGADAWTLKLLLMSCRVASRGVGTVLLHHVMRLARDAYLPTRAQFRPNGRNEIMRMTLRFAGFREISRDGEVQTLQAPLDAPLPPPPPYLRVHVVERVRQS